MNNYKTHGTCCREINFEVKDNKLESVEFIGGCNGNLKAIAKLVKGMDIDQIISTLEGNTCGNRTTSCADQFTKALKEYKMSL